MTDDLAKQANTLAPDRLLAYFVALAEVGGLSVSMTLHVQGQMISGILSSSVLYIDGLSETLSAAAPDPATAQNWKKSLRNAATTGRGKMDALSAEAMPAVIVQIQGHIHLRDASVSLPSGELFTLGWWRGRLSSVDGWVFGA